MYYSWQYSASQNVKQRADSLLSNAEPQRSAHSISAAPWLSARDAIETTTIANPGTLRPINA